MHVRNSQRIKTYEGKACGTCVARKALVGLTCKCPLHRKYPGSTNHHHHLPLDTGLARHSYKREHEIKVLKLDW